MRAILLDIAGNILIGAIFAAVWIGVCAASVWAVVEVVFK